MGTSQTCVLEINFPLLLSALSEAEAEATPRASAPLGPSDVCSFNIWCSNNAARGQTAAAETPSRFYVFEEPKREEKKASGETRLGAMKQQV